MGKRTTRKKKSLKSRVDEATIQRRYELIGIALAAVAVLSLCGLLGFNAGFVGLWLARFFRYCFGVGSWIFVLALLWFGGVCVMKHQEAKYASGIFCFVGFMAFVLALYHHFTVQPGAEILPESLPTGGGHLGGGLLFLLRKVVGVSGGLVVTIAGLLGTFLWMTKWSLSSGILKTRDKAKAGASAARQLACLALLNAGDEVLMADPGYPCNRQFVRMTGAQPVPLPATAATRFQPSAAQIEAAMTPRTRAALLASPANPTGTSIAHDELRAIHAALSARGAATIMDEIYLGLSHDAAYGRSALELGEDIISINSFSKYFCMTGWRLGWLVVPEPLLAAVELTAQHLYISPNTPAQYAALACFEPESLAEYERRRAELKARRDWFVPQLETLGLHVPVMPDGAFYVWAQCEEVARKLCGAPQGNTPEDAPSWRLADALLRRAHVAVTPGRDFGDFGTAACLRFSTASSMEHLQQAVQRIGALLEE